MKSKITRRLAGYFALVLLAFSLVIGGVFAALVQRQAVEKQRDELQRYAQSLADILGSPGSSGLGMNGKGGTMAYLRFIGDVSDAGVWMVDAVGAPLSVSMGHMAQSIEGENLPEALLPLVSQVLRGETAFSDALHTASGADALAVGVPITTADGSVMGGVLLRAQSDHAPAAVRGGLFMLLISLLAALTAAALLAVWLSCSFTRPLARMKTAAAALAGGAYGARADVHQSDEIGELADTLDTLAVRLEEASRESEKLEGLRREFTANISHELRTPVTVLRGSLEALCDGVVSDGPKVAEYHREMLGEARHLERLVNDLLELSRLQNRDFAIEMAPINLLDPLQEARRSAARLGQSKSVYLEMQAPTPLPFEGDYGRLRQMFLIVLDNAVKFSPPGGCVAIAADSEKIVISDQGCGIKEDQLPHIFDRFYRSRSAQNAGGTGLGLAIAAGIARRHGMEITADNLPEGGAVFTFRLAVPMAPESGKCP